eukprot:scaffold19.g1759.t1
MPRTWHNRAAVLHGIDDLRLENFELPDEVPPGHVRVAIKALGICGSDCHYLKRGRIANFIIQKPMVIGHESAGTVAAVGEGVTSLAVGDRVTLEPGVPCWRDPRSREGRYNLDGDLTFHATPPVHGALADFVDHPADWCYRLPEGVSHEEGAMCEPLSVGVHACRRGGVGPGKRVLILGAGPIGLVTLLAAQAFGADLNLELAAGLKSAAPVTTRLSSVLDDPQEAAAQLRAAAAPGGFDVVIDCAGFEATMATALVAAASGGKVVLVGLGQERMHLSLTEAAIREVDILGSFRYCNTYPLCLSFLASGRVDVRPLITHRFAFTKAGVADGFETAHLADQASTGAVKVMFNLTEAEEAGA